VSKSFQQLFIIVFESALEYFLNVMISAAQALFDDIRGEFQLTQANEVLGDLLEYEFVFV
jgi:hypothetical protein